MPFPNIREVRNLTDADSSDDASSPYDLTVNVTGVQAGDRMVLLVPFFGIHGSVGPNTLPDDWTHIGGPMSYPQNTYFDNTLWTNFSRCWVFEKLNCTGFETDFVITKFQDEMMGWLFFIEGSDPLTASYWTGRGWTGLSRKYLNFRYTEAPWGADDTLWLMEGQFSGNNSSSFPPPTPDGFTLLDVGGTDSFPTGNLVSSFVSQKKSRQTNVDILKSSVEWGPTNDTYLAMIGAIPPALQQIARPTGIAEDDAGTAFNAPWADQLMSDDSDSTFFTHEDSSRVMDVALGSIPVDVTQPATLYIRRRRTTNTGVIGLDFSLRGDNVVIKSGSADTSTTSFDTFSVAVNPANWGNKKTNSITLQLTWDYTSGSDGYDVADVWLEYWPNYALLKRGTRMGIAIPTADDTLNTWTDDASGTTDIYQSIQFGDDDNAWVEDDMDGASNETTNVQFEIQVSGAENLNAIVDKDFDMVIEMRLGADTAPSGNVDTYAIELLDNAKFSIASMSVDNDSVAGLNIRWVVKGIWFEPSTDLTGPMYLRISGANSAVGTRTMRVFWAQVHFVYKSRAFANSYKDDAVNTWEDEDAVSTDLFKKLKHRDLRTWVTDDIDFAGSGQRESSVLRVKLPGLSMFNEGATSLRLRSAFKGVWDGATQPEVQFELFDGATSPVSMGTDTLTNIGTEWEWNWSSFDIAGHDLSGFDLEIMGIDASDTTNLMKILVGYLQLEFRPASTALPVSTKTANDWVPATATSFPVQQHQPAVDLQLGDWVGDGAETSDLWDLIDFFESSAWIEAPCDIPVASDFETEVYEVEMSNVPGFFFSGNDDITFNIRHRWSSDLTGTEQMHYDVKTHDSTSIQTGSWNVTSYSGTGVVQQVVVTSANQAGKDVAGGPVSIELKGVTVGGVDTGNPRIYYCYAQGQTSPSLHGAVVDGLDDPWIEDDMDLDIGTEFETTDLQLNFGNLTDISDAGSGRINVRGRMTNTNASNSIELVLTDGSDVSIGSTSIETDNDTSFTDWTWLITDMAGHNYNTPYLQVNGRTADTNAGQQIEIAQITFEYAQVEDVEPLALFFQQQTTDAILAQDDDTEDHTTDARLVDEKQKDHTTDAVLDRNYAGTRIIGIPLDAWQTGDTTDNYQNTTFWQPNGGDDISNVTTIPDAADSLLIIYTLGYHGYDDEYIFAVRQAGGFDRKYFYGNRFLNVLADSTTDNNPPYETDEYRFHTGLITEFDNTSTMDLAVNNPAGSQGQGYDPGDQVVISLKNTRAALNFPRAGAWTTDFAEAGQGTWRRKYTENYALGYPTVSDQGWEPVARPYVDSAMTMFAWTGNKHVSLIDGWNQFGPASTGYRFSIMFNSADFDGAGTDPAGMITDRPGDLLLATYHAFGTDSDWVTDLVPAAGYEDWTQIAYHYNPMTAGSTPEARKHHFAVFAKRVIRAGYHNFAIEPVGWTGEDARWAHGRIDIIRGTDSIDYGRQGFFEPDTQVDRGSWQGDSAETTNLHLLVQPAHAQGMSPWVLDEEITSASTINVKVGADGAGEMRIAQSIQSNTSPFKQLTFRARRVGTPQWPLQVRTQTGFANPNSGVALASRHYQYKWITDTTMADQTINMDKDSFSTGNVSFGPPHGFHYEGSATDYYEIEVATDNPWASGTFWTQTEGTSSSFIEDTAKDIILGFYYDPGSTGDNTNDTDWVESEVIGTGAPETSSILKLGIDFTGLVTPLMTEFGMVVKIRFSNSTNNDPRIKAVQSAIAESGTQIGNWYSQPGPASGTTWADYQIVIPADTVEQIGTWNDVEVWVRGVTVDSGGGTRLRVSAMQIEALGPAGEYPTDNYMLRVTSLVSAGSWEDQGGGVLAAGDISNPDGSVDVATYARSELFSTPADNAWGSELRLGLENPVVTPDIRQAQLKVWTEDEGGSGSGTAAKLGVALYQGTTPIYGYVTMEPYTNDKHFRYVLDIPGEDMDRITDWDALEIRFRFFKQGANTGDFRSTVIAAGLRVAGEPPAGPSEVHQTQAILLGEIEADHTTDARVLIVDDQFHTTDATKVNIDINLDYTTDANLVLRSTEVHTTDAIKVEVTELPHTTDAIKLDTFTPNHTTDAITPDRLTREHTTDAVLMVPQIARPDEDITVTGWETAPTPAQNIYEQLDETIPDPTDYAFWDN